MNNQQQSSTLVMALPFTAAIMLASSVVVEALDLFDDAEAIRKHPKKSKKSDGGGSNSRP